MTETKRFAPFSWNHPIGAEKYLEQLEAQGWRVDTVETFHLYRMKFYRAKPRKMRYTVHLYYGREVSQDYIQSGQEQGWEFLGKTIGGRYAVWRKPYEGERPGPLEYAGLEQIYERDFARKVGVPAGALLLLAACCWALFFWMEGWRGAVERMQNEFWNMAPAIGITAFLLIVCMYAIGHFHKNRT